MTALKGQAAPLGAECSKNQGLVICITLLKELLTSITAFVYKHRIPTGFLTGYLFQINLRRTRQLDDSLVYTAQLVYVVSHVERRGAAVAGHVERNAK